MFILQAADSFTMIHYLEYYSIHTAAALCLHHRAAALPHHAGRLLPLYLHFAQAATTIYWLAHHSAVPHTHYRSVLQRRTDKHSRLRLEHSSAACVNCSALGETLEKQLGATYCQSFQFLTSFLTTAYTLLICT